jgi:hypothetical protein
MTPRASLLACCAVDSICGSAPSEKMTARSTGGGGVAAVLKRVIL